MTKRLHFFRDKTNDNIENIQPFTQAQYLLLDALEGLITVNIINTLNKNKSAKKLSCKGTVVLLKHSQLDGGANKSIINNLDAFEAYWEIDSVSLLGVASNIAIFCTHRGTHNLINKFSTSITHCNVS